jgi:hypothetical protein
MRKKRHSTDGLEKSKEDFSQTKTLSRRGERHVSRLADAAQ